MKPTLSGHDAAEADVNIRVSPRVGLYHRLKDARSAARADERAALPSEPFPVSPAWGEVRGLAREALDGGADIEILAWLCEAELRIGGFAGLRDVFRLTAGLVAERFETLHSIDDETVEDKVAPFAGLNGLGAEGTLIQPLRLTPLVPGAPAFRHSLWDFQMARRPGEDARRRALKEAVAEAGPGAMRERLLTVLDLAAAFRELTAAFEARCGAEAPASSQIRALLDEVRLAVLNLSGIDEASLAPAAPGPGPDDAAPSAGAPGEEPAAGAGPGGPAPIRSREEAFRRLAEVADWFRRSEPQSPTALAIDTVVARARMDFSELLSELIPDEHARRAILVSAGIRPPH